MKAKNNNIRTLDQFKDQHYGKTGTSKRDKLDAGYENFKIGAMIHDARLEKGLTQEQLAEKTGTTKSYISKIENNVKEGYVDGQSGHQLRNCFHERHEWLQTEGNHWSAYTTQDTCVPDAIKAKIGCYKIQKISEDEKKFCWYK